MTDLFIEPVVPQESLRQRVETAIHTAIMIGEFRPGEVLSVPVLASQFGVSATPVREAMLDLERRGFVDAVRNKGFRITEPSAERVRELTEVRVLLEAPVVAGLAGRIPPEGYAELREIAERELEAVRRGDIPARAAEEFAFHGLLVSFAGNSVLTQLVVDLRQQSRVPDLTGLFADGELEASAREHLTLIEHLENGRGAEAEELIRDHIRSILDWFR